jgi:parallel beta-helix repeat protein
MNHTLISVFVILFLMTTKEGHAKNYYVDPLHDTAQANGSISNPWSSINDVNKAAKSILSGDTVFFKKGESFTGTLMIIRGGNLMQPIVYTHYGIGLLPVFSNHSSDVINLYNVQHVIIDGIKIIDHSISKTDHSITAKISYAINVEKSTHCTIRNCDISLVGIGISVTQGSDYTTIQGNHIHNLRMVRNTQLAVNSNDDYGANPVVIGSSNNKVINNYFEECWANSYDYGYDGGAIELFGNEMNGNEFMYNTALNCNGFLEVGSSEVGHAKDNVIAYNKIINCGIIGYYHSTSSYKVNIQNLQYYNNTVVETIQQFTKPAYLFAMQGDGQKGMIVVKNNIFWLTSGVKFASIQFINGQMIHEQNIFNLMNQHDNFRFNKTEKNIMREKIFKSSVGTPQNWDLQLILGSKAVDFGLPVGLNSDFKGHALLGKPDAGAFEFIK